MIALLLSVALAGTIEDARGQSVAVSAPQRIVSLGGGVTELVYALGAGDRVVAVDASSTHPAETEPLRTLGYHRQVSAEGVLSLSPDLVIATTDAGPPVVLEQLERAGVPLVVLDASPGLPALEGRIDMLSALLDVPERGVSLREELSESVARIAPDTAPRVMFIYARGGGTLNVSGSGTAAAEMIALAGATNAVEGYEGYRPLTAESVVMAAPDVLLLTEGGLASLGGQAGLLEQPGLSQTPAGRAGRIVVMDDLLLLGFGPRTGLAAVVLSGALQESGE